MSLDLIENQMDQEPEKIIEVECGLLEKNKVTDGKLSDALQTDNNNGSSGIQKSKTNMLHRCSGSKILSTTTAYLLMLGISFSFTIMGPCLPDLGDIYSLPTDKITTFYIWQGIGNLIASSVFGKVLNHISENLILIPMLLVGAATTTAIPWTSSYPVGSTLFFFRGCCLSAMSLCAHFFILSSWKKKSAPFLQGLHLIYPIGALVSPQIVEPFLMKRNMMKLNVDVTNITSNISEIYTRMVNHTVSQSKSKIHYVFLINGVLILVLSIIFIIDVCIKRETVRLKHRDSNVQISNTIVSSLSEKAYWILFFIYSFSLGCMEISFSALIFTFAVKYLKWINKNGVWIMTLLYSSLLVGRLVGIIGNHYLRLHVTLGLAHGLVLTAVVGLATLVNISNIYLWVITVIYALGMSTLFAGTLSWATEFVSATSVFTSIYLIGYGIGALSGPPLVGFLFRNIGKMYFCYFILISACVFISVYVVLLITHRIKANKKIEGKLRTYLRKEN